MNLLRLTGLPLTVAASIALAGCTQHHTAQDPADAPITATLSTAETPAGALPEPAALTDVLTRLTDPAVPGIDKLALIEGAKPDDAGTIDHFTTALHDGGYLPMTFAANDIDWSSRTPGNTTAEINVTTASPDTPNFVFPMEFKPFAGGWQLSRQTAETLLAFGKAHAPTGTSTTAEPAPPR